MWESELSDLRCRTPAMCRGDTADQWCDGAPKAHPRTGTQDVATPIVLMRTFKKLFLQDVVSTQGHHFFSYSSNSSQGYTWRLQHRRVKIWLLIILQCSHRKIKVYLHVLCARGLSLTAFYCEVKPMPKTMAPTHTGKKCYESNTTFYSLFKREVYLQSLYFRKSLAFIQRQR